jgi:hypothetical protein
MCEHQSDGCPCQENAYDVYWWLLDSLDTRLPERPVAPWAPIGRQGLGKMIRSEGDGKADRSV